MGCSQKVHNSIKKLSHMNGINKAYYFRIVSRIFSIDPITMNMQSFFILKPGGAIRQVPPKERTASEWSGVFFNAEEMLAVFGIIAKAERKDM